MKLKEILSENNLPSIYSKKYIDYLNSILSKLDHRAIGSFIELLVEARKKDSSIFFIGNGGSAATASHFANDISIGTRSTGKPFRAISLTDNVAVLTAIANDNGYEDIFVHQLKVLMRPDDILVAISASGNSKNLIKAVNFAKINGLITVSLTGFDGGDLKKLVDLPIHVDTGFGEYGPAEDSHMVIDHLVGAYLTRLCAEESDS